MKNQPKIEKIIEECGTTEDKLLEILLKVQELSELKYISKDEATFIAEKLNIPLSRIYEVVSFYSRLSMEPRGKHIIEVCKSSACHVKGSHKVLEIIEEILGIKAGKATEDKRFFLEEVSCFGACDVAPAIKIGPEVYGNLDREKLAKIVNSYGRG